MSPTGRPKKNRPEAVRQLFSPPFHPHPCPPPSRGRGFWGFRAGSQAGFSLFEIAVVLFIISLFFILVTVPIEGVLSGGDLGQATRLLMSEVSKLRGEAAYTRKIQTLVLNIEENTFYALEPENPVEFAKTEESLFAEEEVVPIKKDLPSGVFFADVVLETLGKVQEGKAEVRFFANGCVEHTLIHLKNEGGKFYTLEINPVTGLIRTHEGYIEQKREGSRFHTS
jgi:hypothetical protein